MVDARADRSDLRVATVHRQARATLRLSVGFVVAAILAAALNAAGSLRTGAWLPLHLFFVGGLLSAISGVTQMLAVTWSAARAPSPRLAAIQRWTLTIGVGALAAGREVPVTGLAVTGGVLVIVALVLLLVLLAGIRRSRTVDRFLPALDAYLLAVTLGVVGTLGGVVFVADPSAETVRDAVRAHAIINAFGLVGIVIAATIPWFVATQARTRVAPRATPTHVHVIAAALGFTTAVAAAASLSDHATIAALALVGYAATIGSLIAVMPKLGRRQLGWAGPRLVQLLAGLGWWITAAVLLAVDAVRDRAPSRAALEVLAVGAYAQILVASLAYLGPVLRGGGHEALSRGFRITRSWFGLLAANVAALGALIGAPAVFLGALVAWAVDIAVRAIRLAAPISPLAEHPAPR